jgi:hypothetical protein
VPSGNGFACNDNVGVKPSDVLLKGKGAVGKGMGVEVDEEGRDL